MLQRLEKEILGFEIIHLSNVLPEFSSWEVEWWNSNLHKRNVIRGQWVASSGIIQGMQKALDFSHKSYSFALE